MAAFIRNSRWQMLATFAIALYITGAAQAQPNGVADRPAAADRGAPAIVDNEKGGMPSG